MVKQHQILLHIFRVLFVFFLKDLLTPESCKSLLVLLTPDFESQSRHKHLIIPHTLIICKTCVHSCMHLFSYCGNLIGVVSKIDTLSIRLENKSKAKNLCDRHSCTSTNFFFQPWFNGN